MIAVFIYVLAADALTLRSVSKNEAVISRLIKHIRTVVVVIVNKYFNVECVS